MPTSYSSNPLAAWPALRDNRRLLRVGPVAALASASKYLEPPSTLAHRIITRDYHRSSASPNIRARKLGASHQPRKVGSGHRLRNSCKGNQQVWLIDVIDLIGNDHPINLNDELPPCVRSGDQNVG